MALENLFLIFALEQYLFEKRTHRKSHATINN